MTSLQSTVATSLAVDQLVDDKKRATRTQLELHYDVRDPYAVTMRLPEEDWLVERSLLEVGLHDDIGDGEVTVGPVRAGQVPWDRLSGHLPPVSPPLVTITVAARSSAPRRLLVPDASVSRFLFETWAVVRRGREAGSIARELDQFVARLQYSVRPPPDGGC